jgi:hypothetical protein
MHRRDPRDNPPSIGVPARQPAHDATKKTAGMPLPFCADRSKKKVDRERCCRWGAPAERDPTPRPREFDEPTVLEAAMRCFRNRGFEQTSMRDLAGEMDITSASLYNAFGDKRSLYRRALDYYLEQSARDPSTA